jgi:hypothetical protein
VAVLLLVQCWSWQSYWQVMAGSKKPQHCCMASGRVLLLLWLLQQMLVRIRPLQQLRLAYPGLGRSPWKLLRWKRRCCLLMWASGRRHVQLQQQACGLQEQRGMQRQQQQS